MKKILVSLLALFFLFTAALPLYAATFRSSESVYLPENETNMHDVYLFGNSVTVDAPITNDTVAAGNTVTINGDVTGSIISAGNDVVIRSHVNNTVRAAGSTVTISGPIDRDLLVAGGKVRITKEASISGDLLFFGGELTLDGPVKGDIHVNGGSVMINAPVGGNVDGDIAELTLGNNAKINGNLTYIAEQKATIEQGAMVIGHQQYKAQPQRKEAPKGLAAVFPSSAFYDLIVSMIASALLVTFLPILVKTTLEKAVNKPFASAGTGFLLLIFVPFFAIFLLILFWLGLALFLIYGLLLIFSMFMSKLFIGWWVLRWWENRDKKEYILDWKAAIVGPVIAFLLAVIPIFGWLALALIYLMTFGALTRTLISFAGYPNKQLEPIKSKK